MFKNKHKCWVWFFFFVIFFSQAQSQQSLIEEINSGKLSPLDKVIKLDVLFYQNQYSDTIKANYYNKVLLRISKKHKINYGIGLYYHNKSTLDFFKENYNSAIKSSNNAQFFFLKEKVPEVYFFSVYTECLSLLNVGKLDLAENIAIYTTKKFRQNNNTTGMGQMYLFVAESSLQKIKIKTAFIYVKKALECFKRGADILRIAQCDVLMSEMSFALKNYPESINYLESVFKQFPELRKNETYQIIINHQLAKCYFKNRNYYNAIKHADEAILNLKSGNLESKLHEMYLIKADAYQNLGQIKTASLLIAQVDNKIRILGTDKYNLENLKYLNHVQSEIFKKTKNYEKALFFQKKNLQLSKIDIETYLKISELEFKLNHFDSAYYFLTEFNNRKINELNLVKKNNINELEALYELKRKEHLIQKIKIKELNKEIELKEQKEFSKNAIIVSTILTILLLFGLYIYRIRVKVSQILSYKNNKLEKINELLSSSNKDKEVLLKEIHHRVKNNLQLVSSILYIQANDTPDISVSEFLDECQNRISSIALIHQNLYMSEDLDKVGFQQYLEVLVESLINTFSGKERVSRLINAKDIRFNIETSISLGLIISEFICNSIKHAFKNISKGEIIIEINKLADGRYKLIIGDNGNVINDKPISSISIGLELVNLLVMQLKGKITKLTREGTYYEIIFEEVVP